MARKKLTAAEAAQFAPLPFIRVPQPAQTIAQPDPAPEPTPQRLAISATVTTSGDWSLTVPEDTTPAELVALNRRVDAGEFNEAISAALINNQVVTLREDRTLLGRIQHVNSHEADEVTIDAISTEDDD